MAWWLCRSNVLITADTQDLLQRLPEGFLMLIKEGAQLRVRHELLLEALAFLARVPLLQPLRDHLGP